MSSCCRELREGRQPGGSEADSAHQQFMERGPGQDINTTGRKAVQQKRYGWESQDVLSRKTLLLNASCLFPDWKANIDGSIPCPPSERGGCGNGVLELKRNCKASWLSKLLKDAHTLAGSFNFLGGEMSPECSKCESTPEHVASNSELLRASFREKSSDNFLYCPNAIDLDDDDIEHFQKHWGRGEPVIVRGVLEKTTGLSWEPMVMWRAVREQKIKQFKDEGLTVKAIDCFDWCEVAEAEEKTASGLLLMEATKEKPSIGTVVAAEPGPLDEEGNRKPLTVEAGSTVLYSKYAGNEFKSADGSDYITLRASDVMAVIKASHSI